MIHVIKVIFSEHNTSDTSEGTSEPLVHTGRDTTFVFKKNHTGLYFSKVYLKTCLLTRNTFGYV